MKLESATNKTQERKVAEKVSRVWKCDWASIGLYGPFDIYFMRDRCPIAIAEIKVKNQKFNDFPNLFFDLHKWMYLFVAEITCLPAFYIACLQDGIYWVRAGDVPVAGMKWLVTGRTDREDVFSDQRPTLLIPTSYFKFLCDSDGVFEEE